MRGNVHLEFCNRKRGHPELPRSSPGKRTNRPSEVLLHISGKATYQALERRRRGRPHLSTQFSEPWTERTYGRQLISESLFALQSSAGLTAKLESHRQLVEIPAENPRRRQCR
jgi:hypothetical protein